MDYFDILLAKKLNGGGGSPIDLRTLTVTENGEQDAPSGVAYNKVITNVPAPSNAIYKQTLSGLPAPIASFVGADAPLDSLKASIVGVQSGSGDPSPTNIRPISGWSGANVTRTGKNMLDETAGVAGFFKSDGTIQSSQAWKYQYIKVNPNTNYTISNIPASVPAVYLCWFDINKNFISNSGSHDNGTITSPNNAVYLGFCINQNSELGTNIQIEAGNQATTYEAYSGNTYTIPFKDSSDNPIMVYDGDVDVVNGGGKSNFAYIELPSTGWAQEDDKTGVFTNYAIKADAPYPRLICSHAVRASSYNDVINNEGKIGLSASRVLWHTTFATVEELEQYLANNTVQIAYELATPIVMQFDPIALRSNGVTNISVDCGEVTELKYFSETP